MSGRLVAAIRMTPSFASKPSISTSSWFRVCSRSSCPPPSPAPRCRPTASISSTKTIAGAFALACSTRAGPRDVRRLWENLLDFGGPLARLVGSRHIGEGRLGGVLGDELGLGLPELHDPG